jgi:hypothetical protein
MDREAQKNGDLVVAIIKSLSLGPALAGVGYLSAMLIQATRGAFPAPFTPEFHQQYEGMWVVLGAVGFLLGVLRIVKIWRSRG